MPVRNRMYPFLKRQNTIVIIVLYSITFYEFTKLASKKNYMNFKFSGGNESVPFYYLSHMAHVHCSFMRMSLKGSCYVVAL